MAANPLFVSQRSLKSLLILCGIALLSFALLQAFFHSSLKPVPVPEPANLLPLDEDLNASHSLPCSSPISIPDRLFYPSTKTSSKEFNTGGSCNPLTPMFIGFSSNNDLLIQAVISYIEAGWPASEVVVVDNSGTFDDNYMKRLTRKSIHYLDYQSLWDLGVSILATPTRLSFSQLQNFYLRTAQLQEWDYFFWSHMDGVVLSYESVPFHTNIIKSVLSVTKTPSWALVWYKYDHISLVKVKAAERVGPWDIAIPFYPSDCDYYSRVRMHGLRIWDARAGELFDVGSTLPDPKTTFSEAAKNITARNELSVVLKQMTLDKNRQKKKFRSQWQTASPEGGEALSPESRQESSLSLLKEIGRKVYKEKWGRKDCDVSPFFNADLTPI